jgi:putative ATP-binding cassette transporter
LNILGYLFRESSRLMLLATCSAVLAGVSGASLAKVIGDELGGGGDWAPRAWLFFGLCLAYLALKSCSEIALIHLVQGVILRMRVELSRKVLATPQKKLQALGKAELMAIMTNDITAFVQAFQALPVAFGNAVILVVCFLYMAWVSWQLFLLFTVILLVCMAAYHSAERYPLRLMIPLREKLDHLYAHFRDVIEGSKELQLNERRGATFVEDVIAPDARQFRSLFIRTMTRYTWVANVGLILFYVVIGLLLFVVPRWQSESDAVLTTFTLMMLFLVRPISDLMFSLPVLRQAGVSLRKIQQLEGELGTSSPPTGPDPFRAPALQLELRSVCHAYPGPTEDEHFTLGPLDLTLQQGELLFVVGGNGSGKTTLAMILLGLYLPESGELRLNGVPVTSENLSSYRQHFSAVFADFHLFEQLLVTDQERVSARARHYVNRFGMAHKVTVEDGRFSTVRLSSGQRKRLALVSSYLEDRPVYLFDEWAADQDPAFKRVFYTELLPELKARGKAVVVITHDDAYFHLADRIIKLEEGHLQEQVAHSPVAESA